MLHGESMRTLLTYFILAQAILAQHTLYVCGSISKGFVVGKRLEPSGLYIRDGAGGAGGFRHVGFTHPYLATVALAPGGGNTLYAAAGNGVIRMSPAGEHWKILTDWRHTEFQDIAVEAGAPATIYAASTDGIIATNDGGATWREASAGLRRRFIQTLAVDRTRAGRVLAGGEDGLYVSGDGARSWTPVDSSARMVTDIEQSPHDPAVWVAATQGHGILLSRDGGVSWKRLASVPAEGFTWNNADFSPHSPLTLAAVAFSQGVWVSEDLGETWQDRGAGLPTRQVWRARFDPDARGRLWASVHEEALYVSDDSGVSGWRRAGLEGSVALDLVFLPVKGVRP